VISITVSSPERMYLEYTRIPSPIYQYVTNLVVRLPIRTGSSVVKNISMQEHRALNNQIFHVANFTILTLLLLLLSLSLSSS